MPIASSTAKTASDFSSESTVRPVQGGDRKRRILVLEDDEDMAMVFDKIIKSIDGEAEIQIATTAEQVLASLQAHIRDRDKHPYDLIIADIFLEGEATGFDLLKVCRQFFPTVSMIVTSGIGPEQFLASLEKGVPSPTFLRKPFTVQECRNLVEAMLNKPAGLTRSHQL